jgi:hypothetical protein
MDNYVGIYDSIEKNKQLKKQKFDRIKKEENERRMISHGLKSEEFHVIGDKTIKN